MKKRTFKQKLFSLLPKSIRKRIKNFYYNRLIQPAYNLKYKMRYGYWDFFDAISIETTTYCNLRCKNCPNSIYSRSLLKNKKLIDLELFKKIINELAEIRYNGQIMLHFYGEPLSDKRLPDLIHYTRKKLPLAKININSNGFLLTLPMYYTLLKAGVSSFLITQYGENVPKNVLKILEYLKKRPKYENKINYRILGEDIALSNRGGELDVKNVADYEKPICAYPDSAVNIDYEGNVILCCNDYHSSIKFGNLRKEKLIDIWNKPRYRNIRKEVRKGIFKLLICKKCVGIVN